MSCPPFRDASPTRLRPPCCPDRSSAPSPAFPVNFATGHCGNGVGLPIRPGGRSKCRSFTAAGGLPRFGRLVQPDVGRQLKRMRAGLRIGRAIRVFRSQFVAVRSRTASALRSPVIGAVGRRCGRRHRRCSLRSLHPTCAVLATLTLMSLRRAERARSKASDDCSRQRAGHFLRQHFAEEFTEEFFRTPPLRPSRVDTLCAVRPAGSLSDRTTGRLTAGVAEILGQHRDLAFPAGRQVRRERLELSATRRCTSAFARCADAGVAPDRDRRRSRPSPP